MAKTVIATVRVTPEEAAVMRANYGSLPAALRALIDADINQEDS